VAGLVPATHVFTSGPDRLAYMHANDPCFLGLAVHRRNDYAGDDEGAN
jgi:hypothetical protein